MNFCFSIGLIAIGLYGYFHSREIFNQILSALLSFLGLGTLIFLILPLKSSILFFVTITTLISIYIIGLSISLIHGCKNQKSNSLSMDN